MRGVFALFNWSLRLDVRSLGPHLLRLLFVLLLMGSVMWSWMNSLTMAAPGLSLFNAICHMNVVLIIFGGIFYFSTTVTEEKEADSLALLRLAGMGPLSILLGKFSSRLIGGLMLLMVQFPFTLLAITLGGVTFHQILAAYIALPAFMVLVASIGLLASIRCHTSGNAAGLTGLLLLLLFVTPAVVHFSLLSQTGGLTGPRLSKLPPNPKLERLIQADEFLFDTSMLKRLEAINATGFAETVFSTQVKFHLGCAAILLFGCWLVFEPSSRDSSKPVRGTLFKRTSPLRWLGVSRTWTRQPFAWKEFYFLTGGQTFFVTKFVLFGAIAGVIWWVIQRSPTGVARSDFGQTFILIMGCVVLLECCVYAARIYFDEVRWKSLASITLTPNSTKRIAWTKVLGCAIALFPACFWLGVAAYFLQTQVGAMMREPYSWFMVLQFITFLHLGALFSLYFRWGAMPLAFLVTFVFHSCCPLLMFGFMISDAIIDKEGGLAIMGIVLGIAVHWVVLLLPVELEIAAKLRRAAAD